MQENQATNQYPSERTLGRPVVVALAAAIFGVLAMLQAQARRKA
jgi:hypothetical protein